MKPRSWLVLGVLGVLLGLAGCGGARPASTGPAPVPVPGPVTAGQLAGVTLRVGDQKGIGAQALLRASGQLDGVPYHLEWSTFTSGPPMLEAINANAVDIGQVGNTPPIFSAAAGGNIQIVAAQRSAVGDAVLVPKGSPITSLADLRGRTIAVAKGSSANGTLLNALAAAKLGPTDVHLSYLQPSDAYAAFVQGSVAAWVVWEPYVAQTVAEQGARELVNGADAFTGAGPAGGRPLSNALTVQVAGRSALADAGKNAAIRDYVTRIEKAQLWAKSHAGAWSSIYAQLTGIPASVAQVAVPRLLATPIPIDDGLVASEQQLADAFSAAGQLPGKVGMAGYVDRRYNDVASQLAASGR